MKDDSPESVETTPWWVGKTSGSYDPMHPANIEARKHDPVVDGIDWEDIIMTTQADFEAGRYCFNSEDYATHEEAMKAMAAFIHSIAEEVEREAAAVPSLHAQG